ncbi:MAG: AraC family transcriptional regulator [Clostridia bacterium]|nr:AraC family transcriptional regulator [Clostridia bacterium]
MSFYEQQADSKKYFYFRRGKQIPTTSHFHSALEFLFVENGEQEVVVGGEKRVLETGDACFVNSFCVHSYPYVKNASTVVIVGDKRYFDPAFSSFLGKKPPTYFRFENMQLLQTLHDLCEQNHPSDGGRYATIEGAMGILLGAIAQNTPFIDPIDDKQDALVFDVLHYAETHLQDDLSLRTVAKKFGYSYEHLSRLLRKYLHENWTTHVNRLRVIKTQSILENDPKTAVFPAALSCGFESANTFYRAYKKEFGVCPKRR